MTTLADAAVRHPRHVLLAALVAGLLCAQSPPAAAGVAAGLALAAARRGRGGGADDPRARRGAAARQGTESALALVAAAVVLAGAIAGAARLAALDRTALGPLLGRTVSLRATLLERPRPNHRAPGNDAARSPSSGPGGGGGGEAWSSPNRPAAGDDAAGSPSSRARGAAALVRLVAGRGRGERVVVRAVRWPALRVGAEVVVRGRLKALGPWDGWQRRRGAHARLFADRVEATGRTRGGLAGAIDRLRARAENSVAAGLDGPRAGLARGMVLGEDEALTEAVRDDFRASGLAHLVAASGQNVALLAALAIPALAALGAGLRGRLAGALALIAVYVPLAGAGPSIQRAGVMGGAGLVAGLAGRPASRAYALLLAAAATLALNPRTAADPGWQLSFAAVAAIAALASPLSRRLATRGLPRPLAEAIAMTTAATLATAPLLAVHFGRVSLVSLPANVLAATAVAPAMWLGMLAIVAGGLVPGAAMLVNALAQYPLAFVGWVAAAAARVPFASVPAPPLPVAAGATAIAVAVAAWARGVRLTPILWRGWRGGKRSPVPPWPLARDLAANELRRSSEPRRRSRRRAAVLLAVAALAAAIGAALPGCRGAPPAPDPADLVVSFLDVGQGDATLIQHGGAAVLVDTGPPGGPLLRRLREAGVKRLDLLVITHAQADHEGEAAHVLDRYPVGLLLDGGDAGASGLGATAPAWAYAARVARPPILAAARRRRVRRVVPDAGQAIRAGPIELDVLWPRREPPAAHAGQDPNQRAIVARLRDGDFDLLLPADAESDVTAALALPAVEALKVAHHGSADPGTAGLLARLRPRVAVIEVGRHNPYGHPTAATLRALRAAVPTVHRTDRDGTVRLVVHRGAMRVTTGR